MKLLRWAVAGASVYAVYKYSIGNKATGEDIFTSPERAVAELEEASGKSAQETEKPAVKPAKAKPPRKKSAKG
ncbi:MAG: hypothetical protein KUG65_08850 [Sphingomonadaceae bacterium]|nr:hypothetical protein [Sphingomonadaceae bacterium]